MNQKYNKLRVSDICKDHDESLGMFSNKSIKSKYEFYYFLVKHTGGVYFLFFGWWRLPRNSLCAQNHSASMLESCVILVIVCISGSPHFLYVVSSWASWTLGDVFDIPKAFTVLGVCKTFHSASQDFLCAMIQKRVLPCSYCSHSGPATAFEWSSRGTPVEGFVVIQVGGD